MLVPANESVAIVFVDCCIDSGFVDVEVTIGEEASDCSEVCGMFDHHPTLREEFFS